MKKRTGCALLMLCLCQIAPLAGAQTGISAQGSIDKKQITIGERVVYTLSFTFPDTYRMTPSEKKPDFGPWELKDVQSATHVNEGHTTLDLRYTLTTFTTGHISIPELVFSYSDASKKTHAIKTSPVPVVVESLIEKKGDTGDIRDIKGPLSMKRSIAVYLFWASVIAALLLAAFFVFKKYRDQTTGKDETGVPEGPQIPPDQRAFEAFEMLKNSRLVQEGHIKEYYIALTDIIRDFLGAVYTLETRDKTTNELYASLKQKEPNKKTINAVKDFFDIGDLVKFAKYRPDEKACGDDFESAVKIVKDISEVYLGKP